MPRDTDHIADCLHRVAQFRHWVASNQLFPTVSDETVHPLLHYLREAEHILIAVMYDRGEIDRVAAMDKVI